MIRIHFQLFDLEPMTSGNLQKELANSFAHHSLDNPYFGLLRPNQMVARVIDALAAPPRRIAMPQRYRTSAVGDGTPFSSPP